MKYICRTPIALQIKNRLYTSILRPIVTYGYQLLHSKINTTPIEKFERYWLRCSYNMWKADQEDLYRTSQLTKISDVIKDGRRKYTESILDRNFTKRNLPLQIKSPKRKHTIALKELIDTFAPNSY